MLALSLGKKNKCYMDQFTEALQKSKAVNRMVDSFVNKDIVAQDSLQLDELEKGKAGQIGEIRTWGSKKYQKTAKGWRPVKTGARDGGSQKESEEEKKETAKQNLSESKNEDGWKEGFGGGVIWKEYSDSDFKVVEIKKDDKNKYHLNIGGYKAPNAITESEAVEKKISEIRSQSYDSLDEAKMMADVVSRMKYSDIVKESKTPKEENHLSATKTRISKYEEKISAEIKKLQEKLETAKKQAETTAKVEAAIPDVFKRAGLGLKSATLILNEDNPESQYFNVEADIPGKFMVKGAHGSNSANARAYENALAKAAILSSMVEVFFEEKGLTVKASINPYSLQYKDSSEKDNSTARIDLKISNYGK